MKKSESGFALIVATMLLPLIILIMASLWGLRGLLRPWEMALQTCRHGLWEIQKEQIDQAQKLIALNPQVLQLRASAKQAKVELALAEASADPAAFAVAKANSDAISAQQDVLFGRQEQIHKIAQLKLEENWLKYRSELSAQAQQFQQQTQSWLKFNLTLESAKAPQLAVREIPHSDDGPAEWDVVSPVAATLDMRWQMAWNFSLFKDQNINPAEDIRWQPALIKTQRQCAVTIISEGKTWKPALTEARSSWN